MKILSILAFTILFFAFGNIVSAQSCKDSEPTEFQGECANIINEIAKVNKVKRIRGKVTAPNGEAVVSVIEVYEISSTEKDLRPYDIAKDKSPTNKFETNESGEFCLKSLPNGYYVLKIGSRGVFNCVWLKVELSKRGSKKSLKIELTLGI